MRAIHIKCPNCGAQLDVPEAAHTARCNYCGTSARIQHRTKFLERPAPMPKPQPQEVRMPVATVQHGIKWIVTVTTLLPLILGGIITFTVLKRTGGLSKIKDAMTNAKSAIQHSGANEPLWSGSGNGLLFDVNGDGVTDVIGHIRYVQKNDTLHVAAFDGNDGERLWKAPSFGNHDDAVSGLLALHGDTVLQADSRGNLTGYDAKTGEQKWKVSMGEQLDHMCGNSPESVALKLKDKRWKFVSLANGEMVPLDDAPEPCSRLTVHKERHQADHEYVGRHGDGRHKGVPRKMDDMHIDYTVRLLPDGPLVALGYKQPGTRVPMIGLLSREQEAEDESKKHRRRHKQQPYELSWHSELPAVDPLSVKEGEPEYVSVTANHVCTTYEPKSGAPHAVCFDIQTGRRMWDTPLPNHNTFVIRGIDVTKTRVFVNHWGRLDAFDLSSGNRIFSVGL